MRKARICDLQSVFTGVVRPQCTVGSPTFEQQVIRAAVSSLAYTTRLLHTAWENPAVGSSYWTIGPTAARRARKFPENIGCPSVG